MKKLWTLLFSMLIPASLSALPVGNPRDAGLLTQSIILDECCLPCSYLNFRIGFYGDYVFDRHMQFDSFGISSDVRDTELYTNAGYLALSWCERLEVFATLGASDFSFITPIRQIHSTTGQSQELYLFTETDFSWSVGVKGTIWECGCLSLGAEGQYFYTSPSVNSMGIVNIDPSSLYPENATIKYSEWQIGLGVAYQFCIAPCSTTFVPYAAIKYARAHIDSSILFPGTFFVTPIPVPDLKSNRNFGYALGLTLVGCGKVSVTTEVRFVDEKAFHVNAQFQF